MEERDPVLRNGEDPDFLLELTSALHSVSVPADMTTALVAEAGEKLGIEVDLALQQSFVAADVKRGGKHEARVARIGAESHWDLWRTRELLDLARDVGAGRIGRDRGRDELKRIQSAPPLYGRPLVLLGYALYSGAVATRVGGTLIDAGAGALVGLLAGAIHYSGKHSRTADLQQSFLAGFCGSLVALLLGLLLPIHYPEALFGGVTLIVPAMVLTIAVHEIAENSLESGVIRLVYGLLRFLMIGFGIGACMHLWRLFGPLPVVHPTVGLPVPAVLAVLVVGACGLVFCLQARMNQVGWMIFAVLLAYGTQELTRQLFGEPGAPFASAFVVGVAGHLHGRATGHLPLTMIVPGLLQLAPGFLGTRAVLELLQGKGGHPATFFDVLLVALQLVTGLLVATLLFERHHDPARGKPRMP